jgi:hypothetical protein
MILQRLMFAATLLLAATAHAQYKVSEIVTRGGQVMNAEQIRAEIIGATISGNTENGFQFELQLTPAGKLDGMVHTPRGPSGMAGSWSINARNQVCTDFTFLAWGTGAKRCVWYWKAGNEYFSTNSRNDDEASAKFVDCLMSGGKECDGSFSVAKRSVRK